MSVWNSFKKKLNEGWSGLDAWDQEENKVQRDQFAGLQPAPQEQVVVKPRPAPQSGMMGIPTAQPTTQVQDLFKNKQEPQVDVATPAPAPPVAVEPPKPEAPKQTYRVYKPTKTENKTIFGWNAAAVLPKSLEKRVATENMDDTGTEESLLKWYDGRNPELRNQYVNRLKKESEQGNANAKFTLDTLTKTGRMKGDFNDLTAGYNDKYWGGIQREGLRVADMLLPGKNTWGLEKLADQQDASKLGANQVTDMGRKGETLGTVSKGIRDVGNLAKASNYVDDAVKQSKWVTHLDELAQGSKYAQTALKGAKIIPGSLAGTGVDLLQEVGRSNDTNVGRSAAIGVGMDLGTPVFLKAAGRLLRRSGGEELVETGINKIPRLLGKGEEVASDGKNVMVKFSDDLRNTSGVDSKLQRISSENINAGSDTLATDLDPKQVAKYVDDIKNGRPIDPLVVEKQGDAVFLQDGKHRLAALRQLGVDEVPVVTRDVNKVAQATPVGEAPRSINNIQQNPLEAISARREAWKTADDATRADMARRVEAEAGEDIMRGANPWSKQEVYRDLLSKGLAPDEVTNLTRRYDLNAQEWRTVLNATGDLSNARSVPAVLDSQIQKVLNKPKTVKILRPDEASKLEQVAPITPNTKVIDTGSEVIAVPKKTDISPELATQAPDSKLGKMAQEFYDGKKGNQKIRFVDIENLGKNVSKQVDADFKAIGTDYPTVARKVQEGARNKARTLEEAGLTKPEADILRKAQAEMNYVRRRASIGRKEIGTGDFDEMYLPQQKAGQYDDRADLLEGFRDVKPGSEFKRRNKIQLEDLDYSPDVIGQYVTRYGDTKLLRQERLSRALMRAYPDADPRALDNATLKLLNLQDDVNKIKTKIGAFGFGTRKQLSDGEVIDTASRMTEIGNDLGRPIQTVNGVPHGLTNGDKINSVELNGQKLGDALGLNQYRDAQSFASKQLTDAQGSRQALADMVRTRLTNDYNISPDDIEYAVGGIERMAQNVPDEVALANVMSTYQNAGKQQLMNTLQGVDIKNNKLRKEVSAVTNQILREGSMESELSAKVVKRVLQGQNAIFRKFNVSSALNELSDLSSFKSYYGKNFKLIPDFKAIKEFGLGDIDAAIQPYIDELERGGSLTGVLKKINDGSNLYKFVEHYKAGVVASTARDMYMKQGLKGDLLTAKVIDDYRKLALPVDAFTKTILDNAPLYTQYQTWGLRNLQKEGRLLTGKMGGGILEDKTTLERIARNAYANLPAKTVFWLSSNALKGTALMTAFGLTDFTGLTNQDYSGIAEEDKSLFDKTTGITNSSTTLSLLNSVVQSYEKEQLAKSDKYKDANYNPYENADLDKDILEKYTPGFVKNITKTNDMRDKGYSENKDGRVQYEAPEDFWNTAKSYIFGKSQTDNAREYSGNESVFNREGNPIKNVIDMAKESVGIKETDYNRPLSEDYSTAYKQANDGAQKALLQGGRQYNAYLDNLKKEQPEAYNAYISAMDGNHVSPEYWKSIAGGDPAKIDLNTFKMMGNRKKQEAKDLGKQYDPTYDLTDEQARSVVQQKATATGDDIALRNALYKEQWYQDYMAKMKGFFDSKTPTDSDYEQTQRVKNWYALNDQYSTPDATQFPLVADQKAMTAKYGFGSEATKNWFRANGDAYQAQKAQYDANQLSIINKMREIEGYPPMSPEQYEQVTEVADTSGKSSGGYSKGGGGGGGYAKEGDYGKTGALNVASAKIKVSKVKIKPKKSKYVKIKKTKIT